MINFKNCENSLEILVKNGVIIPCPQTVLIEETVKISKDTVIMPNTIILGNTEIGENCIIGPNSYIKDSKIKKGYAFENIEEMCEFLVQKHLGIENEVFMVTCFDVAGKWICSDIL